MSGENRIQSVDLVPLPSRTTSNPIFGITHDSSNSPTYNSQFDEGVIQQSEAFSLLGFTLHGLNKVIDILGGRAQLENLTTYEVYIDAILPILSGSITLSLCGKLQSRDDEAENAGVGEANVFVSHSSKCFFLDLLDTLISTFPSTTSESGKAAIFWIDIFSLSPEERQQKGSECSTALRRCKSTIQEINRVVLVCSPQPLDREFPQEMPTPFTRTWCLWEVKF